MKNIAVICVLLAVSSAKPIMVTFGTNQGPIVPREKPTIPPQTKNIQPQNPAPVSEETEDIPNPEIYKPLMPQQYRRKIHSQKPTPYLILGTPLDRVNKYEVYRKEEGVTLGVDYTGPHLFEQQEYEFFEAKKVKPSSSSSHYIGNKQNDRRVPQIGIIYSAGVRYYIPQIIYDNYRQEEQENSVYDHSNEKEFFRRNKLSTN